MKKMNRLFWAIACVFGIFFSSPVFSEEGKAPASCPKEKIAVATGISTGTYSKMFQSVANLPELSDIVCEYTQTSGGYDNVLLLMDRKVDAGIVQADVFDFLNKTNPDIRKNLRSLFAMHGSSMHIFVLKNGTECKTVTPGKIRMLDKTVTSIVKIENLRDLKGLKVAALSSAVVTGTEVSDLLKLNLDIVETTKDGGFEKLKNGEVYAFLAMGGKPIDWIDKVDANIFTLANVDSTDIQALGSPFYNTKLQYKKFGAIGTNAITARNDFVVWDYKGKKSALLSKIYDTVFENLADVKEDMSSHPCWQEITEENITDVFWQKYEPPATNKSKREKVESESTSEQPSSEMVITPAVKKHRGK
ncbi:MAG: hypothetical protein WAV31_00980 [Candidatus Moraniibacteriota bacterium]